jgi:hypothetical protein
VQRYNIAVIEVMAKELDQPFWQNLRRRLERELSRVQEFNRL